MTQVFTITMSLTALFTGFFELVEQLENSLMVYFNKNKVVPYLHDKMCLDSHYITEQ